MTKTGDKKHPINVWTDGSAINRKGKVPGGFAIVLTWKDRRKEVQGSWPGATNNEMELMGLLAALRQVKFSDDPLIIRTDSQYAMKAVTEWIRGWKDNGWVNSQGAPVKNQELIRLIDFELQKHRRVRSVEIKHVKGHAGNTENERADYLAGHARKYRKWTFHERTQLPQSRDELIDQAKRTDSTTSTQGSLL